MRADSKRGDGTLEREAQRTAWPAQDVTAVETRLLTGDPALPP